MGVWTGTDFVSVKTTLLDHLLSDVRVASGLLAFSLQLLDNYAARDKDGIPFHTISQFLSKGMFCLYSGSFLLYSDHSPNESTEEVRVK